MLTGCLEEQRAGMPGTSDRVNRSGLLKVPRMIEDDLDDDSGDASGIGLAEIWGVLQMQRHVIAGATAAVLGLVVVITVLMPREYTATAVVHLAPVAAKEIQTDGVQTDITAQWNRNIDVATKLAIIDSKAFRQRVLEGFRALNPDAEVARSVGEIGRATDANSRRGTELIDIKVTTTDPEASAMLANLTAEAFQEEARNNNIDAARSARQWLAEQLVEYEERIRTTTFELNEFERQNGLAGSTGEGEASLDSRMESLHSAYGSLNTELVLQETLVKGYERLLNSGRYEDLAKSMSSPIVDALVLRYAEAAADRARIAAIYGEKMPERRAADAKLEGIEKELLREVRKSLSAEKAKLELLRSKEESIVGAIGGGKEQILALQTLWGEYDKLRTERANAKDYYQRLRSRMGELELQSKTQFNRVRVVEAASAPSSPSSPVVYLNLLGGLIVGLATGFGIAFLREWFDDTVGSPVDVTAYLRVPFLGAIPKVEGVEDESRLALFSHDKPRSQIAEAARQVRTVLELNPAKRIPHRILVTSAVSSEGKTSTAIRLGIAYASSHRKVVVVDCDLRRPRVHKVFGGTRDQGMSTLIEGGELDDCARPTGVPGLSYVSSGRAGERPDELLSAPGLSKVMDDLSDAFDIVIVDSPPTVIVADARLLSRYVDGVVLVGRENSTPRSLMREGISGLQQVGASVFGVVLNAVDFKHRRTSYKYYGYGYGYTYDEELVEQPAK